MCVTHHCYLLAESVLLVLRMTLTEYFSVCITLTAPLTRLVSGSISPLLLSANLITVIGPGY